MGAKIITKTDRQMEDRLHAVADDPVRADTLQKARAFKRTWLELDEGAEAPDLNRQFGKLAFPQTERDRRDKLRASIAQAARRLSSLIAEDGAPVPRPLAIKLEETIGELLETIEN